MKFVYCMANVCNPGGMERVLLNKVSWLVNHGHDVTVVTTDQKNRPAFYPFPEKVRFVDLDVNYTDDNSKGTLGKSLGYLRRKRLHRKRLEELLMRERPDFTVSLFPCESGFIPSLKDGSRKVLELHFSKNFRRQYGRGGLMGALDRWRSRKDEKLVRRFDRFVVLTEEDRSRWGEWPGICVIPNAALPLGVSADSSAKRVIAVGRLDFQKGFDRLVDAWALLMKRRPDLCEWRLDIFGQGEWRDMLVGRIEQSGLKNAFVNGPTKDIARRYAESSVIAMTSHYEGFPMVLIEAMGCGLAPVTFTYQCGPRDIIEDGKNGLLVEEGDVRAFSSALEKIMDSRDLRSAIGAEARSVCTRFSEERVMKMWMRLFDDIKSER